jgi:hypothetical protein
MGDELFHADRRTDMTKLIVVFRNFPNAPNNDKTTLQRKQKKKSMQQEQYNKVQ